MKSLIVVSMLLLTMMANASETRKSCKKKGFKYDRKSKSCKDRKTSKRKRCEKKSGSWNESSGKCEGLVKLKGKEKRALKLVQKAAKKSKHGKKLTYQEQVELAKDLASYAKKNKVRLKKIKISFDTTGRQSGTTGAELKEVSSQQGVKLYHIDEGSDEVQTSSSSHSINIETEERDITIPTNFFPPNLHRYTSEGQEELVAAIVGNDPDWHVFNITIVESSASKLANTGGDYKFSSGDTNAEKNKKLLGLALARSNSTAEMLASEFPEVKIINKKNAVVSGPADCYGSGDTSGEQAPSKILIACKNRNKKVVSEHYNQFQYVKLTVEYMKETKEIIEVLNDETINVPNAEGILAKFKHSKRYKKKKRRRKKKFRLKFKKRRRSKRYKPRRRGKKPKPLPCPKW